ncbi:hypothetical protein B0J18DRAFT_11502 [Chaetomium sp. MPI-SDFR-AT-0129]|nr:hypothetical protein B0J18DRAFT_11502 [Chaetomium sp. MPI-SDFR-AT-0129]
MEVDRQEEPESPMIEDFLDCDQFGTDSDADSSGSFSPQRSLKRLHIHVDMSNAHFLAPRAHHGEQPQIDGLPICTSGPTTAGFPSAELDPYSAVSGVSSFNYPAAADPSLLTPATSSGSPPLPSKQSAKPGQSGYHHPQTQSLTTQAPTPPDTSKMFNYNGYELNSGSQSPSPMTVNPAVTEAGAFMSNYPMTHSPPLSHHPSSPKTEIPPPIDPYLGHFTVSANDGEVPHQHSMADYHPYAVDVTQSGHYLHQPHVPVSTPHMHHRMPSNTTTPDMSHPAQFRPQSTARPGAIEDLRDPAMLLGPYPPHGAPSPGRRAPPRKKAVSARKASRTPKMPAHNREGSTGGPSQLSEDGEELTLRDDAPEDDKFLFQLRKQFISEKGKGMWEEMKAKYSESHQGNWEKAALQMKVSRAVARYGVWPKREIERLKEAFDYFEEMRYQFIIARMKEMGGCQVWDWKRAHVIAMLVKLGLEEPTVNEKTGTRRRKQKAAARRQGSPPSSAGHPSMMSDWPTGLGLHHAAYHAQAHHVANAAAIRQQHHHHGQYDTMMADGFAPQSTLTSKEEEDLINDVFNDVKAERSLSPEDDAMADDEDQQTPVPSYGNGKQHPDTPGATRLSAAQDLNNRPPSVRVARQACDQMLQHSPTQLSDPTGHYGAQ